MNINPTEFKEMELRNCNFVKTVLMILVVLYHGCVFWTEGWFSVLSPDISCKALGVFSKWLNTFHIYGFTLASGYIYYHIRYEKGRYDRFIPFVLNKAKRLLIPYCFTSVIWVIPVSILFYKPSLQMIIKNYAFAAAPSQLWFLIMLFVVFVMFHAISNFVKNHFMIGAAIIGAFYCFSIVGSLLMPNVFQILRACAYMPFFWLGFVIRQYGSSIIRKIPIVLWVLMHTVLFFFSMYVKEIDGFVFKVVDIGLSFAVNVAGALMAFVVLQRVAELVNWQNSKFFGYLKMNSMPVYLFHQQIIYFVIYYLNGIINPYLHAFLNFAISLAVSLMISHVLMKFKVTRLLIGEK